MSISDLFGLSLPRGSLMGNQSVVDSPNYRNYQHHGQHRNQTSSHQRYQVNQYWIYICKDFITSLKFVARVKAS